MKLTSNTKLLRKLLILCLLTVGLVFVASKDATPVSAKTCWEAFDDFSGALDTYDSAFQSYYYNAPTSCNQDCSIYPTSDPRYTSCYNSCRIDRRTDLGNANIGILQAGADINSCTDPSPNFCANAETIEADCQTRYDYTQYSDPE